MGDAGDEAMRAELAKELEIVINRHSAENGSDTPDFILAHYLMMCLDAFDATINWREQWYGRKPRVTAGDLTNPPETKP